MINRIFSTVRRFVRRRDTPLLSPREAYELWAETYDQRDHNALLFAEEAAVVRLLHSLPLKGKTVLDAGCGTGRYFARILEGNPRKLVGVDPSPAMLNKAREKVSGATPVEFHEAEIQKLGLASSSFDFILCTLALDHTPNIRDSFSELSRVARRRGHLLFSVFHPTAQILGWKRTFISENGGTKARAVHYFPYRVSDYLNAAHDAGFVLLQCVEPVVDESVEHIYKAIGRMDFYRRSKGLPLALVMLFKKP